MIIPLLITYSDDNLKSLKQDAKTIIEHLSGLHTCQFHYYEAQKSRQRVLITIEGEEWCIIAEFGENTPHLTNPWFRKKNQVECVDDDSVLVRECFVMLKSIHCDPFKEIVSCQYDDAREALNLIDACKKLVKPITPARSESEREIWTAYCDGLNALNKEHRDFITIDSVSSPILYSDTRQGDIYTLKLGVKPKSVIEIPNHLHLLLDNKYQVADISQKDDDATLLISFKNIEKIAEDDYNDLKNYLFSFGYSPSKEGVVNTLNASVSFKAISDRKEDVSKFISRLLDEGVIETYQDGLSFILDDDSQLTTIENISNEIFCGTSQIKISRRISVYPTIDELDKIREQLAGMDGLSVEQDKIVLLPDSAGNYIEIKNRVTSILLKYDVNVEFPEYTYLATLEARNDSHYRREKLSLVDQRFKELKSLSSSYTFDLEQAWVIRMEFIFQTAQQREELISLIKSSFSDLGPEMKLIMKNPRGASRIEFNRAAIAIDSLEEEYKTSYNDEEIKLVNGRAFNDYFKGIKDPENIIDPDVRSKYARFMNDCPIIGTCHKRTINTIIVKLSDDFYNGELLGQRIYPGDMVFFPSVGTYTELKRQTEAMLRINKPGKQPNGRNVQPPVNCKLSNFLFNPLYAKNIVEDIQEKKDQIRARCLESRLNDKQIEAVAKAILAKDIAFIQGPPGTGKTTVIAEIIWQIIQDDPHSRILLTSQTNLAVDNALERLKKEKSIRPLRVVSEQRADEDAVFNLSLLDEWAIEPNEYNKGNVVEAWIDSIADRVPRDNRFSVITAEWYYALRDKEQTIREDFVNLYQQNANLIASTCSICGSQQFRTNFKKMFGKEDVAFDVVIMDEASKATPLEMAVPMVLGKKIILIGDHKQLPPLLDANSIDTALNKIGRQDLANRIQDLKESQFKKLFLLAQKHRPNLVATLDTQYRMHKDIMKTINQFYTDDLGHKGLICGIEDVMDKIDYKDKGSRWHGLSNEPFLSPSTHAIWVDVHGHEESEYTSRKNMDEVSAIRSIIKALTKSKGFSKYINAQEGIENKEIGIITFYSAQKKYLKRLEQEGGLDPRYDYRIDVVDKFQGMERNIVIVSTVRSNKRNDIGFAKEIERINVAFSRAKTLLIVVGNKDLFSSYSSYAESISVMKTIEIKTIEDLLKYETNN